MLGLEQMKPDDQIRVGIFVVLGLALQCVLMGLISESPTRSWVFHGIAGALAVWALISFTDWSTRLAAVGGLVAFVNDVLLVVESESSLRFVIPSTVLLVASGFVAYQTFSAPNLSARRTQATSQARTRGMVRSGLEQVAGQFGDAPGAAAAIANVPNLRREIRNSSKDPAWVPFLLIGGSIATIFSLATAKWVSAEALFGLVRRTYDFGDLREIYEELGVRYFSRAYYFEWGYLVSYAAAIASMVFAVVVLTKRFEIDRYFKTGAFCLLGFAFVSHTGLVVGLNNAAEEFLVLWGSWIGSLGLLSSIIGLWLSGRR
jgi:hypothetical protein